jgi:hypothetical protein
MTRLRALAAVAGAFLWVAFPIACSGVGAVIEDVDAGADGTVVTPCVAGQPGCPDAPDGALPDVTLTDASDDAVDEPDATVTTPDGAILDAGPDVFEAGPDVFDAGPDVLDAGPDVFDAGQPDADDGGCSGSLVRCGATCVDTTSSTANCGSCAHPCGTANTSATACTTSTCSFTCTGSFLHCPSSADSSGCNIDKNTDDANCGSCGNSCNTASTGKTCQGGTCMCAGGQPACNGVCTDVQTTSAHCGACGYACVNGRTCAGGRCTPAWLPMTTTGAPSARNSASPGIGAAVGGKLVVAGGTVGCGVSLASGGIYDSPTDTWAAIPALNNARSQYQLVSSGTDVYAYGGLSDCGNGTTQLATLERWKPGDAAWSVLSGTNPPAQRYANEAVWTGSKLFIYGGSSGSAPHVSSGAVYDPGLNAWSDASAPDATYERNDAWTIVDQGYIRFWGTNGGNAPANIQYQISNGAWSAWAPPAAFPTMLGNHVDDGRRVMLLAGSCSTNIDVTLYDRNTQTAVVDTATSPAGMSPDPAVAWSGSEMLVWSGFCASGPSTVGGRYQPPAPAP